MTHVIGSFRLLLGGVSHIVKKLTMCFLFRAMHLRVITFFLPFLYRFGSSKFSKHCLPYWVKFFDTGGLFSVHRNHVTSVSSKPILFFVKKYSEGGGGMEHHLS